MSKAKRALVSDDLEGRISRNLLVPASHPDAWIVITGPWAGLAYAPTAGQRATREPLASTAQPWAPGGQR